MKTQDDSIYFSEVNNKGSHIKIYKWDNEYPKKAKIGENSILFINEIGQEIELPIKNWQSFIMFLAESFMLADHESQDIEFEGEITLNIKALGRKKRC